MRSNPGPRLCQSRERGGRLLLHIFAFTRSQKPETETHGSQTAERKGQRQLTDITQKDNTEYHPTTPQIQNSYSSPKLNLIEVLSLTCQFPRLMHQYLSTSTSPHSWSGILADSLRTNKSLKTL